MSEKSATDTPMLRQYRDIKAEHQDAILFFRLGDFYEMFLEDAVTAAKELELTLTGRGKDENRIPMCGVPYHAADNYIPRLIQKGYKVAICEQVEAATAGKGITKREVVKIITPGTLMDEGSIQDTQNNYLAAISSSAKKHHFSYLDISTGEFKVGQSDEKSSLLALIERLNPKEVMITEDSDIQLPDSVLINTITARPVESAESNLKNHFQLHDLSAWGLGSHKSALPLAWAILDYAMHTQKNTLPQVTQLLADTSNDTLFLDRATIKNLELTHSLHDKTDKGTLFHTLNACKTAMGQRRLKQLITAPFRDTQIITQRLDALNALKSDLLSREEIRDCLNTVYDIERLIARIASHKQNPRDLLALKDSLHYLNDLVDILSHFSTPLLHHYHQALSERTQDHHPIQKIITLIQNSLNDSVPITIREGDLIKPGYSDELDTLKASFQSTKDWFSTLEERERDSTGIKSLKVAYNKVFGYTINVTHTHKDLVPEHYIRKQTLANAERYITPELKEKESQLLNGESQQFALEAKLYETIVQEIVKDITHLQSLAQDLADIDVLQSLATVAQKNNYHPPTFTNTDTLSLSLTQNRHPVIEKNSNTPFIPNDIHMKKEENRFILITGPNMAGKSTLMRQVALSVIMAQMGSFVPADTATISPVDKLFTRIGALDNLYSGQSTFMVEMLESASILHTATENSLIILDEIGRGTATFDGMSIACAISEYIHQEIGARTLFATHYHELSTLAKNHPEIANYSMGISDIDNTLVFTHKFQKGPADKSYGIHVANMAGLPKKVIKSAEALLQGFEFHGSDYLKTRQVDQLSLF